MINNMQGGVSLRVEGYEIFFGIMRIMRSPTSRPFDVLGEWLYKPDTRCWYCGGASYPEQVCEPIESFTTIRGKRHE